MIQKLLGEQIDVHMGGVDLIFPHHQNEIAQSEAVTKKNLAKYWIHNEHLLVDNKKMSKSLGNYYTLHDLLDKGFKPMGIRYLLLSTHYRQKLNLTFEGLDAAQAAVKSLNEFMLHIKGSDVKDSPKVDRLVAAVLKKFTKCMDNDLNISEALAAIFEFHTKVNKLQGYSKSDGKKISDVMLKINKVLGVLTISNDAAPAQVLRLIGKRESARAAKDFKKADKIRCEIKKLGWYVEDLESGPSARKV